jgi:argininosuccinate synthase
VHEAQFFEPALRDIERYLEHTQKRVTGTVRMRLEPYRCSVAGVASPYDLMSPKFGRYGEMNLGWTGEDVRGFARILANQTAMYYALGSDDAID